MDWGFASLSSALVRRHVNSPDKPLQPESQQEVAQALKAFGGDREMCRAKDRASDKPT